MTSAQFARVEGFGRTASAAKGAKRAKKGQKRKATTRAFNAREILAEALREPDACPHVAAPQPPVVLWGDVQALADALDAPAPPRKRNKGERKDAPILLAGIASAPWPPGDPRSAPWQADVLAHVQVLYGANLRAVIAHVDEKYDHMHFYAVMSDLAPVAALHAGMAARDAVKAAGGKGYERKGAYDQAMRAWQDDFHAAVSIRHGHTRVGPMRARLSRAEHLASQQAAEHAAAVMSKVASIDAQAADLEAREDKLAKGKVTQRALLQDMQAAHARNMQREKELDVRESALAEREVQVERKASKLKALLKSFYDSMSMLFKRMSWVDKDAIADLVRDVDKVQTDFAKLEPVKALTKAQNNTAP